uniref:Uncharacterized protein n=1 Tax=Mantoniella antarctica TaxID=81844 RepID=A0A7S0SWG3_9CHLO|mmetsp:Transcript_35709/g.89204  ORF Transcript_35709/g.89204 Transcript_35709/m.89204 type:complete len:314 (+) Transcript_35709:192-1133(+)|eukprot:CAMPEP_0181385874 /NCGR_PEP_ID=MMETSP1106-20121128/22809_1 /TAXON_ID=81844 /ORGANISM="Mantoniella antarctica, Strain SL-175" /LENGTH=313 /DNA_ID=CAMNT_0023505997 /DNA_START=94 /DNA_END=1035 /DNA_ORIENTATION=-
MEPDSQKNRQPRRSALTSALEELALQSDAHAEDERRQDEDTAHGGSASITVGSPSGMRGPSFAAPHIRVMNSDTEHHPYGGGEVASPMYSDQEDMAQSAGRQHGSFNCLSMLAGECSTPYAAASVPRAGFSFTGGQSACTTADGRNSNSDMSFAYSLGTGGGGVRGGGGRGGGDRGGGGGGSSGAFVSTSDDVSGHASTSSGGGGNDGHAVNVRALHEEVLRSGSTHGAPGERGTMMPIPRLVVVHPFHDEDDNCISAAGKKQRGSFNSLLLLEAHRLSVQNAHTSPSSLSHHAGGTYGNADVDAPCTFQVTA